MKANRNALLLLLILGIVLPQTGCSQNATEGYFQSTIFVPDGSFTSSIEGPAVDRSGSLYAVNFERKGTIGKVSPDGEVELFVELPQGSVGNGIRFNSMGEMLIADYVGHNILKVDMKSKNIEVLANEDRMYQPNDITIDSKDRIYASDPDWKNKKGRIWRIDPDGGVKMLKDSLGTTNGIEVSPDDKILYVNETVQRKVWAYDLSEKGELSNKRLLINFSDFMMDGMRCDVKGNLYITRYGKGTIVVVTPKGEIIKEIQLQGSNPSNLTFGGEDGKTVYVTIQDNGSIEKFQAPFAGRE